MMREHMYASTAPVSAAPRAIVPAPQRRRGAWGKGVKAGTTGGCGWQMSPLPSPSRPLAGHHRRY